MCLLLTDRFLKLKVLYNDGIAVDFADSKQEEK